MSLDKSGKASKLGKGKKVREQVPVTVFSQWVLVTGQTYCPQAEPKKEERGKKEEKSKKSKQLVFCSLHCQTAWLGNEAVCVCVDAGVYS